VSRSVVFNLLTSGLIILATLALLGAATLITEAPLAAPAPVVDDESVYEFYDAVNTVLRTGDPTALNRVAVPNLVVRTRENNTLLPESTELAATLLALHGIAPGLQLSVQEVSAAGDQVVVQLLQSTTTPSTWLGLPIDPLPEFWGPVDILRFEGDRVAEVWSSAPPTPHFSVLGNALLDTGAASDLFLSVQRLSSDAGSTWSLPTTLRPRGVCVAAGGLGVSINAPPVTQAEITAARRGERDVRVLRPGSSATVVAGETLTLAPGISAVLQGDATRGSFLAYDVSFSPYRYTGPLQAKTELLRTDANWRVSPLLQDPLIDAAPAGVPPGVLEIACGQLTLPPRAPLVLGTSAGSLMLAVESGTLDLVLRLPGPEAPGASGDAQVDSLRAMILTEHEDAVLVPAGATATLLAGDEPVRVTAITVRPQS
jgi:hypothetical protein